MKRHLMSCLRWVYFCYVYQENWSNQETYTQYPCRICWFPWAFLAYANCFACKKIYSRYNLGMLSWSCFSLSFTFIRRTAVIYSHAECYVVCIELSKDLLCSMCRHPCSLSPLWIRLAFFGLQILPVQLASWIMLIIWREVLRKLQ